MTSTCDICPRRCGVNRELGEVGVCGAPANIKVALADLHFWEEPPISGDSGSGAIFFSHCPLKCIYCQNFSISRGGKGREVSLEELQGMMMDLQSRGAKNINLVSATQWAPQVIDAILQLGSQLRIPIVWNTSSYESVKTIRMLNGVVDTYLADFKYYSNDLAKAFSGASDYFDVATLAILEMVKAKKNVVVRHLVLPGHKNDSKLIVKHVQQTFGKSVTLSIMNQYTPVLKTQAERGDTWAARQLEKYPELGNVLSEEEYEEVLDYADKIGVENYFWQEGETCKESFIPAF